MIAAIQAKDCVSCYAPIQPYDGGLYCYECDPREEGQTGG